MFVDSTVVSGRMTGKTAQVSLQMSCTFCFIFWLVDRAGYAAICNAGSRYQFLDVTDISCVLHAQLLSEQPVCSYRHSNTDLPSHHKLTPIAVLIESSKLFMKPRKFWRHGSATRVTRTCCCNRFSVRNWGTAMNHRRITKRLAGW